MAQILTDRTLKGTVHIGGQEHFYLEPTNCAVVPGKEKGEFTAHVSSQSVDDCQGMLATFLDTPRHKIKCIGHRLGGGFGGKQGGLLPIMTSAAANKFNRGVRLTLTSGQDMTVTGKRHEVLVKYEVSINKSGKIAHLDVKVYASSGVCADVSPIFVQTLITKIGGPYTLKNFSGEGFACKTNVPGNVAMRGFGAPEGAFVAETIMDHLCQHFKLDPLSTRAINLTRENDLLHFSDNTVVGCTLVQCWEECLKNSEYIKILQEVTKFNSKSPTIKQGVAIVPMKMPITLRAKFLMQGLCKVQVYKDGSVLLQSGTYSICFFAFSRN